MTEQPKGKLPQGLWLCGKCLVKMDIGFFLHLQRIDTDYIKCKDCRKNYAQFKFLTRYVKSKNLVIHNK